MKRSSRIREFFFLPWVKIFIFIYAVLAALIIGPIWLCSPNGSLALVLTIVAIIALALILILWYIIAESY